MHSPLTQQKTILWDGRMQQEGRCPEHSSSNKKQGPVMAEEQYVRTACNLKDQAKVDPMAEEGKKGTLMLWMWTKPKQTEPNLSQEPSNDSLLMRRSNCKLKDDASDARNKDISVEITQTSPKEHQGDQLYQLKESSG